MHEFNNDSLSLPNTKCGEANDYFDDMIHRYAQSDQLFESVVDDNHGNVYCQMQIKCVFLQKLQKDAKSIQEELRIVQDRQPPQSVEIEKFQFGKPNTPNNRDAIFLVVREFSEQLRYTLDSVNFFADCYRENPEEYYYLYPLEGNFHSQCDLFMNFE